MKNIFLGLLIALGLTAAGSAQGVGFNGGSNIHTAYVRSDFTDASSTALQNIPGLQLVLPAGQVLPFRFECDLFYSQATAAADNFGVQFSASPTNAEVGGIVATNATAYASGTPAAITTTAATNVVSFTPAVTTVLYAHIGGLIEAAGGAADNTMNVMVAQATGANVIVVKRGSVCHYWGLP